MTYFVLILAALGIAALGFFLRRRSAFWGQLLIAVAIVGCACAFGWQVRKTLFPPPPLAINRADAIVSYNLVTLMQHDIAGRSGKVLLLLPPAKALDTKSAEAAANAFSAPLLRGHPELAVEVVRLGTAKTRTASLADFQEALARFPAAIGHVSFAGLPPGFESALPTEQNGSTPFYVFDPDQTTHWLKPLKAGRVRGVIVPRPDVNPADAKSAAGLPGDIFSQFYLLATPATADAIAAKLTANR